MRPITKILLLAIAAFIVYLLWPHSPNLRNFKPNQLAELEVKSWVADKRDRGLEALVERYKVYNTQYGFSPVSSFQIARAQRAGIKELRVFLRNSENPDATVENRVLAFFREKFGRIKRQVNGDFDPDVLAREEMAWRSLEAGGAPVDQVAAPMSRILAGLYGGEEADYKDVAKGWATARAFIYGDSLPSDGSDPVQDAKQEMRDAVSLLKELANPGVSVAGNE